MKTTPIIPLIGSLIALTGITALVWYYSKPLAERQALDRKAESLAQQWYETNVDHLNVKQVQRIYDEVKKIG